MSEATSGLPATDPAFRYAHAGYRDWGEAVPINIAYTSRPGFRVPISVALQNLHWGHPPDCGNRRGSPSLKRGDAKNGEPRMKTLLGALALVAILSAPALAQRSPYYGSQSPSANQSPASPNYTGNGY